MPFFKASSFEFLCFLTNLISILILVESNSQSETLISGNYHYSRLSNDLRRGDAHHVVARISRIQHEISVQNSMEMAPLVREASDIVNPTEEQCKTDEDLTRSYFVTENCPPKRAKRCWCLFKSNPACNSECSYSLIEPAPSCSVPSPIGTKFYTKDDCGERRDNICYCITKEKAYCTSDCSRILDGVRVKKNKGK